MEKNDETCFITVTLIKDNLQADYRILLSEILYSDIHSLLESKVEELRAQIAKHKKAMPPQKPKFSVI